MSERSASIAATSSSSVPTRGATDGGSAGCGTVDGGAGFGRVFQSGGDQEPAAGCSGATGAGAGAWVGGATGNAGCAGAGADHVSVDAIHDCGSGCAAGAEASAVQADVRTGATWLTGAS